MKSNKNSLIKLFVFELVFLLASVIGLVMFWNRYDGANQIGVDQASVILLTLINGVIAGLGFSRARKAKHVVLSVLFVLLFALAIIGCVYSILIIAIGAGFKDIYLQIAP